MLILKLLLIGQSQGEQLLTVSSWVNQTKAIDSHSRRSSHLHTQPLLAPTHKGFPSCKEASSQTLSIDKIISLSLSPPNISFFDQNPPIRLFLTSLFRVCSNPFSQNLIWLCNCSSFSFWSKFDLRKKEGFLDYLFLFFSGFFSGKNFGQWFHRMLQGGIFATSRCGLRGFDFIPPTRNWFFIIWRGRSVVEGWSSTSSPRLMSISGTLRNYLVCFFFFFF